LQVVVHLCIYFDRTIEKLDKNGHKKDFSHDLQAVWKQLERSLQFNTSRHLTPFMQILPYWIKSQIFWDNVIDAHLNSIKKMMQSFSLVKHPKPYADRLFSLLTCMLYHNDQTPFDHIIRATLEAYCKSTAQRHYRIPLLKKLLQVYNNKKFYRLKLNNKGSEPIHQDFQELSAVDMTLKDIETFSVTLRDAFNDFDHIDLSNDDKFCLYMRQRDPLVPAWIDFGLESLRFADCY
jgi:hypothetical protein